MKLDAYLSISRHGIFYFRWPLPFTNDQQGRASLRLSLRTRCPDRAGILARYLASCAETIRRAKGLTRLRLDQIRDMVRGYLQTKLQEYLAQLDDTGLSETRLNAVRTAMDEHHRALAGGDTELSDRFIDTDDFIYFAFLSTADWVDNKTQFMTELRRGSRDQLQHLLGEAEKRQAYDFDEETDTDTRDTASPDTKPAKALSTPKSTPLAGVIEDYLAEQSRAGIWNQKTTDKNRTALEHLIEIFGAEHDITTLTQHDAQDAKKLMLALPANRNKLPQTRNLSIHDAVKVKGVPTIKVDTLNRYLATFAMLFEWAAKNGYGCEQLFAGMKLPKPKRTVAERLPFDPEALRLMHRELLSDTKGLVRKESYKWGALIGMFTGARLNEICQLEIADIEQEGDIWYFNITDEGDGNKSVKTLASRRKVPVHSALIEAGFLEFWQSRKGGQRLFPDFPYCAKNGYGRNLGRWFNERFTPALGIKSSQHVFHSFRHTMVTRLVQSDVQVEKARCIVGHEQAGVTLQVYMREKFTLAQIRDAIEQFRVL